MADQTITVFRCAWREGATDRAFDHDTEDGANRHKVWLERGNEGMKYPVLAQVYAVKVYVDDEGGAA